MREAAAAEMAVWAAAAGRVEDDALRLRSSIDTADAAGFNLPPSLTTETAREMRSASIYLDARQERERTGRSKKKSRFCQWSIEFVQLAARTHARTSEPLSRKPGVSKEHVGLPKACQLVVRRLFLLQLVVRQLVICQLVLHQLVVHRLSRSTR